MFCVDTQNHFLKMTIAASYLFSKANFSIKIFQIISSELPIPADNFFFKSSVLNKYDL